MDDTQRRIVILRGIPGSGKSTLAAKLIKQGYMAVSKDAIRHMINGYQHTDEILVHEIQTDIIKQFILFNKNIVVDNTHSRLSYVNDLKQMINSYLLDRDKQVNYVTVVINIDTPLNECIERDAKREHPVGEEIIRRMHKQLYG